MKDTAAPATIKQLYEDWQTPWEAGDAAAVVSFYTDDAIQMPAGEPEILGKQTFQESLEAFFSRFTVTGNSSDIHEVEATGDFAFARGAYVLTLTPKSGGKATRASGKFLHIFKREPDGSWKIHRAIGADDPPSKA